MSDCQHEWADVSIDQSGDENVFSCLKCGQRLVAGGLAAAVIKAEQQLGVTNKLLPLGVIEIVDMPMTWTPATPTKLGWYWFRFGPIAEPVMFYVFVRAGLHGGELWVRHALPLMSEKPVSDYDGEWAGPLEPPA